MNNNFAFSTVLQGAATESSGNTSILGRDNSSDAKSHTVTPHSERSELEKHQSYIAQKIIEEASKLAEDKDETNVEAWHKRAQQVVSIIEFIVIILFCSSGII